MSWDSISEPLDKSHRLERNDSVNLLSKMWLNSQESGSLLVYTCTRSLIRFLVMHSVTHWDALGFEYLVMSAWELLNKTSAGCCTVACKLSIRSRDVLECLNFSTAQSSMCDGSAQALSICDQGLKHSCYHLLSYTVFLPFIF